MTVYDPGDFFNRRGSLIEPLVVEAINEMGVAIELGSDGLLYRYKDGVWIGDGEREVAQRMAVLLREQTSIRHIRAVQGIMRAGHYEFDLLAEPPAIQLSTINVANGVVNLAVDGMPKLMPHDPSYRFRHQVPVNWNPQSVSHKVDDFLLEALGDPEVVEFMLEWMGYTMLPALNLKLALLLYSPQSDSGKTTMLSLITHLLGKHNTSAVPLKAIDDDRFMRANIENKFANISGDLTAEAPITSATFKALVGGDEVSIERKGVQATKMKNTAKLLFAANVLPQTTDQEAAYFRRWHVVPFPKEFDYDPYFLERLTTQTELEGLLVKAALGAQRIINRVPVGFGELPMPVDTATAAYRTEADTVFRFIMEETKPNPNNRLARSHLYAAYRQWTLENGQKPLAAPKFYRRVEAIDHIHSVHDGGGRYLEGIEVPFPVASEIVKGWHKDV